MDVRFSNAPRVYVAHYTRCCTALDKILKSNSLQLGPLCKTNDPRETQTWQFRVDNKDSCSSRENEKYNRILKYGCKVLCVSQDDENASGPDICLRCFAKPRLWAQYARKHRGVCLIFDKVTLAQTLNNEFGAALKSGAVQYGIVPGSRGWATSRGAFNLSSGDIARRGADELLRDHRNEHYGAFFLLKDKDWESEAEYRWIVFRETDEPVFISVRPALRAILLGVDFPARRLSDVHRYCQQYDASLSRVLWDNGMPRVHWFEPKELSDPQCQKHLKQYRLIPEDDGGSL
jgi:hypothetical protein